ncbi:unnamed protein product [Pleuronectes platessa]|uniref:Uncharacterized protein n=1 Tax=Pleuronectes platessa TaxID=8262 RepID=A0A9N7V9D4_PLEPL|nr:unnamed protein product [Pleuronectes platessa]
MLEKWETTFRSKVINEAKHLTQSIELSQLLKAAEKLTESDDTTWDSDMASLLLLLHVLPPTAGRKRTKISPSDAVDKMLHFHKLIPCQSTSSLGAFDELFKSHYVFNLSYDEYLGQVFTFVQITVYNIDVATTNESPRWQDYNLAFRDPLSLANHTFSPSAPSPSMAPAVKPFAYRHLGV